MVQTRFQIGFDSDVFLADLRQYPMSSDFIARKEESKSKIRSKSMRDLEVLRLRNAVPAKGSFSFAPRLTIDATDGTYWR